MTDFIAMPFDGRICSLRDEAAEALRKQRQLHDEEVEAMLRKRQLEDRLDRHRRRAERHRERLIGQGSVVERVADDRAAYGGGPREIRE